MVNNYLFVFFVSICSALAAAPGFNHIYKLEEMNVLEGTFLNWTRPRHGNRVLIRAEGGRIVKFYTIGLLLNEEKRLNMLKGEKIKCFYATRYELIPWIRTHLWEIDYKGEKILNYNYDAFYHRTINRRRATVIMFFISLFLLMAVYYQNKKQT